jgi:hypothetical protein
MHTLQLEIKQSPAIGFGIAKGRLPKPFFSQRICASVQVLSRPGAKKVKCSPSKKPLDNRLFEVVLGRNSIHYYPVDFFRSFPLCEKFTTAKE